MPKFRKKPVMIEAVLWDGDSAVANRVLGERYTVDWEYVSPLELAIYIPTLEGKMRVEVGDWLIRGVTGAVYPCKPDIFRATYEEASDERS